MKFDKVLEFLIPVILLLLYVVISMRKTKPKSAPKETHSHAQPPLPPKQVRQSSNSSHQRQIDPIPREKRSVGANSSEKTLLNKLTADPFAHKTKNKMSRAEKLLKGKSTLRDAVLLKEIINRPYD